MRGMARRLEGSRLVWLLLGSLVPLLFLLDWLVDRGAPHGLSLDAQIQVRADGQDPWVFAAPLNGLIGGSGLSVTARAPLRTAIYPWLATPYEAEVDLAISPAVLQLGPGVYERGFTTSIRVWDARRADGLGTPTIPCSGRLTALELVLEGEEIKRADLDLDLICTAAGEDLRWRSGDERVWVLTGPVRLSPSSGRATGQAAQPAPGP